MRPVNLIPLEDRRGEQAPLRTGALVYLVVGAFVAVLIGVTSLVLVGNTIEERKVELGQVEREDAEAVTEAQRLAPYIQFQRFSEQRVLTVTSLADSRFDWERVMRELALVLPSDVWLVKLEGSAAPGSGGGDGGGLRSSIAGPALQLDGCAKGQEGVAAFVTALKDIDGVTRVAVESSELPDEEIGSGAGAAESSSDDCRTREFISKFEIVVAFDAAPVAAAEAIAETAPPATEEEDEGSEEDSGETEEGAEE
jgi:Tfp pilus assembly protein PilN